MQAEALQQTRKELSQLEEEVREQLTAMEQLTAERDACKSGAHEASDRSKVGVVLFVHQGRGGEGGGAGGRLDPFFLTAHMLLYKHAIHCDYGLQVQVGAQEELHSNLSCIMQCVVCLLGTLGRCLEGGPGGSPSGLSLLLGQHHKL